MDRGLWHHPGDAILTKVIPWFEDPLSFVCSPEQMTFASQTMDLLAHDPHSTYFSVARGSRAAIPLELPWLDAEQAVLIAITRNPGDDGALALDYRSDPSDPRVVGSDFWADPSMCRWRVVAPTLSGFVADLGLWSPACHGDTAGAAQPRRGR
ncbi:hypothetical protein [Streptomyces sp. NPDC091027]|uniref:hypothetical protein n=1 Tax=Streptomyces sp. NPDC091027 TaxID=3365971 RepID=UPI0038002C60